MAPLTRLTFALALALFPTCRSTPTPTALATDTATDSATGDAAGTAPRDGASTEDHPTTAPAPAASATHVLVVDPPDASAVLISRVDQPVLGAPEHPLRPDAAGRLTLPRATGDEENVVVLWAPGRAALRYELPRATGEHQVRLEPATELRIRVVDHRGRVPYVWLQAAAPHAPWPWFVRADVDAGGHVRVRGLAQGGYNVWSVPIGFAPTLAAATSGDVRLLALAVPNPPAVAYRFLDRSVVADGAEHDVRVAFGAAGVAGRVVDEHGAPVAAASIRVVSEEGQEARAQTDASGRFDAQVGAAPYVSITASHPAYGLQWPDMNWNGWRHGGPIPDAPIELVLRRGAVLSGRLLDAHGAPMADTALFLIPAYIGSGPATVDARTDAQGRFAFERCVLRDFQLVPGSVREWNTREPGAHVRVARPDTAAWLAAASAGTPVDIPTEAYELLPVALDVSALHARRVQVWLRWGPERYWGTAVDVDARGRAHVTMERGVAHEVWVGTYAPGQRLEAPWRAHQTPQWTGTPGAAMELALARPDAGR